MFPFSVVENIMDAAYLSRTRVMGSYANKFMFSNSHIAIIMSKDYNVKNTSIIVVF